MNLLIKCINCSTGVLYSQDYLAGVSSPCLGSAVQQNTTDTIGKQTISPPPLYLTQVLSWIVLYLRKLYRKRWSDGHGLPLAWRCSNQLWPRSTTHSLTTHSDLWWTGLSRYFVTLVLSSNCSPELLCTPLRPCARPLTLVISAGKAEQEIRPAKKPRAR